jgi:hypothetical protein
MRCTKLLVLLILLPARMFSRRQMTGRDHIFKCSVSLAFGGLVAIALRFDSRHAGD